ncbi:hypothetical protein [Actinospica sp.]|uniref:hypothetical protein n=1 Tax=Actinospica sp. TaxID=1872142 RepID=UPI002C3E4F14|nr:hypothetical protein [Actinospica sp.]HWG27090.1 hypothetical protein [Actinospica sp.]
MIIRHIFTIALTGSIALACGGGTCISTAAADAGASGFPVYDNTFYSNVNLERVGAVKSNVIYEAPIAQLAGQNPENFRGTRPRGAELALPAKSAYEAYVQRTSSHPGPVVLDFETLYLKGARSVAERHYQKLRKLLEWAHEAVPGRTVGYYGVLGNTNPHYYKLERRLAEREDALFPSLYTFSDNRPAWRTRFRQIMAEAATVAPGKPVDAYLWPQYHGGTKLAGRYLTPDHWRYELETAHQLCSGVVIWSPWASDPDQRWVDETAAFLG